MSVTSCGWDMERRSCRQRRTSAGQSVSWDQDSLSLPHPLTPPPFRYGRVNFILSLRLELLKEVERLQVGPSPQSHSCPPPDWKQERLRHLSVTQESLGVPGDVAYTCETAGHFFLYQAVARWEAYVSKIKPLANKVS